MSDQELSKEIETYQKLAKENPGVDVNMLMMNALQNEASHKSAGKSYKWPYMISLGAPPFGLFFALRYYFSDDENDKQAAKICVLLTVISGLLTYFFFKIVLSSSGTSVQQIEQIKPQDIYQLTQ